MIELLEKKRIIPIVLTILMGIEIFLFSSISGIPSSGGPNIVGIAEVYHFIAFFLFSFFLFVSIKGKSKINKKYLLIVLSISMLYAISDEIHQIFVPMRFVSIEDIFTDFAGIFSSTLLYLKISKN